jgi:hypothetical protein
MTRPLIVSSQDGPRMTVATMMKSPLLIPKRIISMTEQSFLSDAVLRNVGQNSSGVIGYYESTPLFVDDDPEIMSEFGEIPVTNGSMGIPRTKRVVRRARGLRVSKTMQDRNDTDAVNLQIVQIRNTMIRAWEDAFFAAIISNPSVQTMVTDTPWSSATSHIRKDVNASKFLISNAALPGASNNDQKLGFRADTLIISTVTETDFLDSDEVSKPYQGNIADENLLYTGKLPNKFLDLDVLSSWRLDKYVFGGAIVCQRKVVGGYSDERPLQATPMYGEGNGPNGGPTESWRTDITRASAMFLDQPLAAVVISGVHT